MHRVCFVTSNYPPQRGGVARSASRVAGFLSASGLEVHVFILARPGEPAGPAAGAGPGPIVHRIPYDLDRTGAAALITAAVQAVDDEAPFDLFHGFFLPAAYPVLSVAEKRGRPVLASIRGNDAVRWLDDPDPRVRRVVVEVLRRAAWVTSVCSDLLERVGGLAPLAHRSSVIHNSVDPRGMPRWRLDGGNRGVVGTVGELRPKKDVPGLVDAYAGLPPSLRAGLCLVGSMDGGYADLVASRTAAHGIRAEVRTTGWVEEAGVPRRLCGMHVFVQNSLHDGFPNTLLDAAAVGVPLVATPVGGMRDVVVDGESGLLVPPGDSVRLREALLAVLEDDALASRLAAGARRMAEALTPAREAAAWLALYDALLGGVGTGNRAAPSRAEGRGTGAEVFA